MILYLVSTPVLLARPSQTNVMMMMIWNLCIT